MKARIVTTLFFAALFAVAAGAQTLTRQYAAKFICGKASDEQIKNFSFAPGVYYTVINVHNPQLQNPVTIRKKFALANPDERAGKISEFFSTTLKRDEAMQIDCGNIYKHLGIPPGTFIEGFAVLQPTADLDVVGVYTADPGSGVSAIHMERVPRRNAVP